MKEINLEIVKKDSKTFEFRITRNGIAQPINGWYIYFTVKADFNDVDGSALITKSYQFPNNVESTNGIGYLSLTNSETNIVIGEYFYDMKFVDGSYRETFVRGKLTILPSIRIA